MDQFIEENEDAVYSKYCEIYPEEIHSDFTFEDIQFVDVFVESYMEDELEKFLGGQKNERKR